MKDIFIKSEFQQKWLDRLFEKEDQFKGHSAEIDEKAAFPKENIQSLVDMGYTTLPLPESYGGEGLKLYDLILF